MLHTNGNRLKMFYHELHFVWHILKKIDNTHKTYTIIDSYMHINSIPTTTI